MDTFNFRVQIFTPEGEFIKKFGGLGTGLGLFSKPKGIAVDSEGHIYVVDSAFNNVQIFNDEGQLLMFFGKIGSKPGEFWLPAGLAIDQDDKIYVADQYNHRINVFQFLSEKYKATPEYRNSQAAKAVRAAAKDMEKKEQSE
ncbi:MAG TPA: 6-bladed beta-propeller, partial [Nitrospiria bacterium]|nr:6-bladed beta-propeller [Nitrospiria bacterium]